MLNLLIQILTLLSGSIVSFLVPAIFGLEEYGLFLKANILVFVFQKLTDIANEPLISRVDPHSMFPVSMSVCSIVAATFCAINWVYPIGSPALLLSMLLSSSVLLSMYSLKQTARIIVYLVAFLLTFVCALTIRWTGDRQFTIEDILIATNLVPAGIAAITLVSHSNATWKDRRSFKVIYLLGRSIPAMLSLTLVYNLFTNIFPFVLSKTLSPVDLGLFRVIASVVQSATSLFPVNVKAIFVALVASRGDERQYRLIMSFALLYFAAVGIAASVTAVILPKLQPYLLLVATLPTLYWSVVTERFLLVRGDESYVRLLNLSVGLTALVVMLVISNIQMATTCYAVGFSIYAGGLLLKAPRLPVIAVGWVCALPPLVIYLSENTLYLPAIYLIGCVFIGFFLMPIRRSDIRSLRGAL